KGCPGAVANSVCAIHNPSCFSRCLRVPIAIARFYGQYLWIPQTFLPTNPDLHHGLLAALVLSGDQRVVEPWPEPLGAPRGYFLIELPVVEAGVGLQYNVYDFGRRSGRVEATIALRLAAASS